MEITEIKNIPPSKYIQEIIKRDEITTDKELDEIEETFKDWYFNNTVFLYA